MDLINRCDGRSILQRGLQKGGTRNGDWGPGTGKAKMEKNPNANPIPIGNPITHSCTVLFPFFKWNFPYP